MIREQIYLNTTQLHNLSLILCNLHDTPQEEFNPSAIYLSDNSFGGRDWQNAELISSVDHDFGSWLGFDGNHVGSMLTWTSATSGATIPAFCEDPDSWLVTCEQENRDEGQSCSAYFKDLSDAAAGKTAFEWRR